MKSISHHFIEHRFISNFFTQVAEVASTFNSFSPELGEIPLDIVQCYVNSSLWAAVQKVPFSIQVKLLISFSIVQFTHASFFQTLSSIVRKLEGHSASASAWSAGRMAANIIHRFRFDGIQYDRCADTTTGALPLKLDVKVSISQLTSISERLRQSPETVIRITCISYTYFQDIF